MRQRSIAGWKIVTLSLFALVCRGALQPASAQVRVWAVGNNTVGQFGDGTTESRSVSAQLNALPNVRSISGGIYHTAAVLADGTVVTSGNNYWGQLGVNGINSSLGLVHVQGLSNITTVAAGARHNVALKSDGTVWTWGDDSLGQLGDQHYPSSRSVPFQVPGLSGVTAVSAGGYHSMALKADGTVWTWGDNESGQLGDGTGGTGAHAALVQVLGLNNIVSISAGGFFSLALRSDGTVWAWGYDAVGQLGDGSTSNQGVPVQVLGLTDVMAISAGANYSLALKSDGTVWAWGGNDYGQLGDATTTSRSSPIPVVGVSGVTAISAGSYHSLALLNNGTIMGWGDNGIGQLGDGTHQTRPKPPVRATTIVHAKQVIATKGGSSFFLVKDNDPDFDLDGNHDLIWQNTQTGDVSTWYLRGAAWDGSYDFLGRGVPTAWKIVGSGDFDADGKTDLIWQNTQTGDVSYWLMDGTVQVSADYIARNIPLAWKIIGVADFNRDGNPDLVWQNTQTGDVAVWYMGGVNWTFEYDYLGQGVPSEWRVAGTSDLNGDNMPDLVWQNTQTGAVSYWLMNGINRMSGDYIARNIPLDWTLACVMDLNGDLNADLVWQNKTTGDVTVWYMAGYVWNGAYDYIAHGIPLEWKLARTH